MKTETFEQFMARALHHPTTGYYARNIKHIGPRGDFTTAPQLSPLPAIAIANWATQALRTTSARHLIEIGPGLGTLAKNVFQHLPLSLRLRTHLHLVDSSPTLALQQQKLLGKNAHYHTTIHSALTAARGHAVIYSHELVDAFPVRLFQKTPTHWSEVGLTTHTSGKKEILLPITHLPASSIFSQDLPTGQRVEVHASYHTWLSSWLPLWENGSLLTIDYGSLAPQLYHRRPLGSLRAYLLHHRLTGESIYANPGLQDITADVNFTDLIHWSAPYTHSSTTIDFAEMLRPHAQPSDAPLLAASHHFIALHQNRHFGKKQNIPSTPVDTLPPFTPF